MGTNNFYYRNASKVFAVFMNREVPVLDDDFEETDETQSEAPELDEINDSISYYQEQFEEKAKELKIRFDRENDWDNDAPRSFPCRNLGTLSLSKSYAGWDVEVQLKLTVNSGYYEGACLDYKIATFLDGNENDSIEPDDLQYNNINAGLAKIIAPKCNKWIQETIVTLSEVTESIYEDLSEIKLNKVAQFSNGEAIYEQAK